ncbi:Response regulator receiver domain-containing protein [Pustulibacterium marinum]|uniref:Response regulator receiver domain-containing protein n=1 Tax=Pustulibacterium marinum TaxID=1224947 RepID=A0A1I7G9Y1_9FLAO|nr:response regulator [Pustulibacterium marinum]SFU45238.1 Response regulator receiver domain-containing protein [Pustulibacterium marinum]
MLKSICIVDDSSIFLFTAEKMISFLNLAEEVITFKNGEEALTYFKNLKNNEQQFPDLTLLDINMPKMNGWEFLEALKELSIKALNIYIVSSSVDPTDIEKSNMYDVLNGYLYKPLSPEILREVIENCN